MLSDGRVYQCRGRGVFRKRKVTPLVGDYVSFQAENEREGYILDVFERKNELVRPPIANIDQAILVFSAVEPDFNPALLDRFLVLIEAKHIRPIIVVSKMDLVDDETKPRIEQYIRDYRQIGYDVLEVSTKRGQGLNHYSLTSKETCPSLQGSQVSESLLY